MDDVAKRLITALRSSEELYFSLVLLVGRSGSGKTAVLKSVADEIGTEVINVNLKLCENLLELTEKQRILQCKKILEEQISESGKVVVLDNNEILFDTSLKQDPLLILQAISRNRSVVASWNGEYDGSKLIYAEPGHQEYRQYQHVDAMIINAKDYHGVGQEY